MGLFSKESCALCGNKAGAMNRTKFGNEQFLCATCAQKISVDNALLNNMTVEDLKEHLAYRQENENLFNNFKKSRTLKAGKHEICISDEQQLWYVINTKVGNIPNVLKFNELVSFDYSENGNSITKGGAGGAAIGGALFGGVGAVVGASVGKKKSKTELTSMRISISLSHRYTKFIQIEFLPFGIKENPGSSSYNNIFKPNVEKVLALLSEISDRAADNNVPVQSTNQGFSAADEILKYKSLLDQGVITQEEFEAKKKQLLDL